MPTSSAIRRGEGSLSGVGRVQLRYRTWEVQNPRAAIVIVHGLGEHSGRYEFFGERMASYGFSTFAYDQRGHGVSEGRRGHVRSFGAYLQDLDRFRREVQGLTPARTPLFLLGHSMGGLIALRYQEEYNSTFNGAVVIAPWLATAMTVPRWKVTMAAAVSRFLPALPFDNGIDAEDLSHDRDAVEAYRSDPLIHSRITPRLFVEASIAMGLVLQRADQLRDPLLFLFPGQDKVVNAQLGLQFARQLPKDLTTIKLYPNMYHEVLNEVDRHLPMRDVRDWIAARIAR